MTLLLAKLTIAPLLVVASSLAGRRWGAQLSGLLVALPIVAGPILLITDLSHGDRFAARAASAALLGLVALVAFAIGFAWAARRSVWLGALLLGWLACVAVGALGGTVVADVLTTPALRFVAATGAFLLALHLLPTWPATGVPAPARPPSWDLPARAERDLAAEPQPPNLARQSAGAAFRRIRKISAGTFGCLLARLGRRPVAPPDDRGATAVGAERERPELRDLGDGCVRVDPERVKRLLGHGSKATAGSAKGQARTASWTANRDRARDPIRFGSGLAVGTAV